MAESAYEGARRKSVKAMMPNATHVATKPFWHGMDYPAGTQLLPHDRGENAETKWFYAVHPEQTHSTPNVVNLWHDEYAPISK
jgi:hypothetical protein